MKKQVTFSLSALMLTAHISFAAETDQYWVVTDNNTLPEMDCVMEPSEVVDVGSAVPGIVEKIYAQPSDQVKTGAILMQLESDVERAAAELANTRARLNTAILLRKESVAFGELTEQRNQGLLKKAVISKQEMDQLQTETRMARLQVRQERENKLLATLESKRADAVLERRIIRSPVDGVVMERFKATGEYVDEGPVMKVARLDPLKIEVVIPVDFLGRINPEMAAEITPVVTAAKTYLAQVDRIDPVADAASGTFAVRLSLPNPGYLIPAGIRCRVNFLPAEQTVQHNLQEPAGVTPVGQLN
ncbi:efflux RND transporter periplasmic adaptor subunit [Amphritea balenae]|uniref:Efflux RND transporter periplasmic adaptor subunit n=1 Tax=Amphritea balenae TaxID=452629 RepID=A0A3P1SMM6_9GAMM|nr:efflux RND transporter periplasmic adaptor subunit [Amphritea balenae]RRC98174.1 efflux RND transporter periplasmic adaptor subunit [Amphritea balenae]GGK79801.1 hypothetical protein GCM10007941_32570 [Amphritea balenae]